MFFENSFGAAFSMLESKQRDHSTLVGGRHKLRCERSATQVWDSGRNRRLAKDFEAAIPSAEALLYAASAALLLRRLARW